MIAGNAPNLIIAGVHKAGTTSLFTYLSHHPDICGSDIKEIGYFVPLKYNKPLSSFNKYLSYFQNCSHSSFRLEASPSYLYGGKIIAERMKELLGEDLKLIFMLRNPVTRLFSFYNFKKSNYQLSSKMSFQEFYSKSIEKRFTMEPENECEEKLIVRGVKEGFYIEHLPEWFETFDRNIYICFFENFRNNVTGTMEDISEWLNIDYTLFNSGGFTKENKTLIYNNSLLHKTAMVLNNRFESFWRKNINLKRKIRGIYNKVNASSSKLIIQEQDKEFLESFYQPYNIKLASFLKSKGYEKLPQWLANSD